MSFKFVKDGIKPDVLYRNLRRPEVDRLFEERDDLLREMGSLKKQISDGDHLSSQQKQALHNRVQKLQNLVNQKDKEARSLWKTIQQKSKLAEIV